MIGSDGEFVTAHPSCSSVLYEIPFVAISLHRNLAQMSNRHVTTLFQPVLHPVKKLARPAFPLLLRDCTEPYLERK